MDTRDFIKKKTYKIIDKVSLCRLLTRRKKLNLVSKTLFTMETSE